LHLKLVELIFEVIPVRGDEGRGYRVGSKGGLKPKNIYFAE